MGKWTFEMLARSEKTKREELMLRCSAPTFESLAGWEFKGWNCLSPVAALYMKPAGFQRFMKGFYLLPGDPTPADAEILRGYNVKVTRGGVSDDWVDRKDEKGEPVRHSFYETYRSGEGARFGPYSQALFIDYGIPGNGLLDGKGIRDFLIQVEPDNPDLFLGKAYMKVGPFHFPAAFFVLERLRQHSFEG